MGLLSACRTSPWAILASAIAVCGSFSAAKAGW